MEQHCSAPVETVYGLLTDPKWLEARCLALGETSATVKVRRAAGGATLTMKRRVRRELPALIAKVMASEADLAFEETWLAPVDGRRTGTLRMEVVGQPVTMRAEFELVPVGKGCIYRITHHCKSTVPLLGAAVARFALGQVEQTCTDELAYLAAHLKQRE